VWPRRGRVNEKNGVDHNRHNIKLCIATSLGHYLSHPGPIWTCLTLLFGFIQPVIYRPHRYVSPTFEFLRFGSWSDSSIEFLMGAKSISAKKSAAMKLTAKKSMAKKSIVKNSTVKNSTAKMSMVKTSTVKESAAKESVAKNPTAKAPGQKAAPKQCVTIGKENHSPATITPASASAPILVRCLHAQPLVHALDEGMPICYYHS